MLSKKNIITTIFLLLTVCCFAAGKNSGIKWINSNFGNVQIKIQPHKGTIQTPNLAMQFKEVFQMLRQNIPWMIPSQVNVEVYQDKRNFLHYNRELTENWSGAFFDPEQNIIVMYDEPKNQTHMMKKFTHELTHLFFENTFNPPESKAPSKEPPVWLNEGLAVNMEDISKTPQGGVWDNDLIVINIFSDGERKVLKERKENGGLTQKEKEGFRKFAVSDKIVFFKDFVDFMEDDSYDKAVAEGKVDDWYLQAYAMVRFLFRPTNSATPAKRMQFEQLIKTISKYQPLRDENGRIMTNENGKKIMARPDVEDALQTVYRYRDSREFEEKFWKWLTLYQAQGRKKIRSGL